MADGIRIEMQEILESQNRLPAYHRTDFGECAMLSRTMSLQPGISGWLAIHLTLTLLESGFTCPSGFFFGNV